MKRLMLIGAAFALALSSAFAMAAQRWWEPAVSEGRSLYTVRPIADRIARRSSGTPLVVWLGDSTILPVVGIASYPERIRERIRAKGKKVQSISVAHAGIGPFVEYCLAGKIVELRPEALFIVANQVALTRSGKERGALETASMIPSDEFVRAAFLPWHSADITIPRLLLARTLGLSGVAEPFYFLEGLRQMFRDELYTSTKKLTLADHGRLARRRVTKLSTPIDASSAQVVMLAAIVDLAVRRGIRATVVLSPVRAGSFDHISAREVILAERSRILEEVVVGAGGRFVDLDDALGRGMFRDYGGHFTDEGTERMARLLEPLVLQDAFAR